jgi:hypothetical protein
VDRSGWIAIGGAVGVLGLLTAVLFVAAGDAPASVPLAPVAVVATSPRPALALAEPQGPSERERPTDAEDSRARAILAGQHRRHAFLGKVSEFGGATRDVSLMLAMPTAEWRALSTADKAALVRYMNTQPPLARWHPERFTDTPRSAPLYETIIGRVSKIRDGNWFIMGGTLVEHGTDMDEGDVLACGNSYDGCQEAKTARALLAKWKQ